MIEVIPRGDNAHLLYWHVEFIALYNLFNPHHYILSYQQAQKTNVSSTFVYKMTSNVTQTINTPFG